MARRAALLIVLLLAAAARAAADPPPPIDLAERHAAEVKALVPLMRQAERERYGRQAWYLAWRVTQAEPGHAEAVGILKAHPVNSLLSDVVLAPLKPFATKRDSVLADEGDAYAQAARVLLGAGVKVVDIQPVMERALAYGSKAADLLASVADAGYVWAGTWGAQKADAVETALGPIRGTVTFPPEWDDLYLAVRPRWAAAKILAVGEFRLVTDDAFLAACRHAVLLSAVESQVTAVFGTGDKKGRDDAGPTDVFVVPDADAYAVCGAAWLGPSVDPKTKALFDPSSGWEWSWRPRRILVLPRDRANAWTGDDAPFLFHVARAATRLRLAPTSGRMNGRGAWILDGVGGLFEGFAAKGPYGGDFEPGRCWRLHAAKAMRESRSLLPWDELLQTDRTTQNDRARATVTMKFRGAERTATNVDVVAAQATAFVWALLHADDGKAARKVGPLLSETMARDRLPDVDKAMGWPKGRAAKEADKALDALVTE